MSFWLVYFLFYLPVGFVNLLFWLFLWQNKEYRGDKMMDYIGLPESLKVVFNPWTTLRIVFFATIVVGNFIFNLNIDWLLTIFLFLWPLETLMFIIKLMLKRRVNLPKFTNKARVILFLSFLFLIGLPFLIQQKNYAGYLYGFNYILLIMPFWIGYIILMLFPIDWKVKSDYFKQARKHRDSIPNLHVTAISGAFGKTTTKDILGEILGKRVELIKTEKNQNSNMSCAKKTFTLKADTQYFLCELGSYQKGDGAEICQFIKPDSSIITGLNLQHYSLFGSRENIISTESESLRFLPKGGKAFINWNSEMCHEIEIPDGINLIKCATEEDSINSNNIDYLATNINTSIEGTEFQLHHEEKVWKFKTNLFSIGNIQNIVICLAYCHEMGFDISSFSKDLLDLKTTEGRMEMFTKPWGKMLYNAYNNSDGIMNILDFAKTTKLKSVVILDDIMELGKKSTEIHREIAQEIFDLNPERVVLLGRSFSQVIAQELALQGYDAKNISFWNGKNSTENKKSIKEILEGKKENIVLLLGYQSKNFLDI